MHHAIFWNLFLSLTQLRKDRISPILLIMPSPLGYFTDKDYKTFLDHINSISLATSVSVIRADNLDKSFLEDTTNFADHIHMTQKGSIIFSRLLGSKLNILFNELSLKLNSPPI